MTVIPHRQAADANATARSMATTGSGIQCHYIEALPLFWGRPIYR